MKKYKKIYAWRVLEEIKKGTEVKCVDRENGIVFDVNTTIVAVVLAILGEYENQECEGRYEFYCVEKVKEGAENGNI